MAQIDFNQITATAAHYHYDQAAASHTHSISDHSHSISGVFYQQKEKEPEMTTLEKIRRERQEARERRRIEAEYEAYDLARLDDYPAGTVMRFTWESKEKTYTYAALFVDERWFVTGGSSPNGLPTEDFVAWLIGKKISVSALVPLAVGDE